MITPRYQARLPVAVADVHPGRRSGTARAASRPKRISINSLLLVVFGAVVLSTAAIELWILRARVGTGGAAVAVLSLGDLPVKADGWVAPGSSDVDVENGGSDAAPFVQGPLGNMLGLDDEEDDGVVADDDDADRAHTREDGGRGGVVDVGSTPDTSGGGENTLNEDIKSSADGGVLTSSGLILRPPGIVVLGMHRSGTSMLGGLLSVGAGFEVPGKHLLVNSQNKKGFYETFECCMANDALLVAQDMRWDDLQRGPFRPQTAAEQVLRKQTHRKWKRHGGNGKKCMNNFRPDAEVSWMMKDPRLCLTLRTWLRFYTPGWHGRGVNHEDRRPAAVFTFRHPLEVARSLHVRTVGTIPTLVAGLRLWIEYNVRAIVNSQDICRVVTSNERILGDPLMEIERVLGELVKRCGVVVPRPDGTDATVAADFVDPSLSRQHADPGDLIRDHGGGCEVRAYKGLPDDDETADGERAWYLRAMELFCNMKSGAAFQEDYAWPARDVDGNRIAQDTAPAIVDGDGAVHFDSVRVAAALQRTEDACSAPRGCALRVLNERSGREGILTLSRPTRGMYAGTWANTGLDAGWATGDVVKFLDYDRADYTERMIDVAKYSGPGGTDFEDVRMGQRGISAQKKRDTVVEYDLGGTHLLTGMWTDSGWDTPYNVEILRHGAEDWTVLYTEQRRTVMYKERVFASHVRIRWVGHPRFPTGTVHADPLGMQVGRCALLFFGLPKMFKRVVLPSITKYIVDMNPTCDIYAHAFNVTDMETNSKSNQAKASISDNLHPEDIFNLTKDASISTNEEFAAQVDTSEYMLHFPHKYSGKGQGQWVYPTSLENMLKQWYSIEGAWRAMKAGADQKLKEMGGVEGPYYETIGLFRMNVMYTTPIDVHDGNAVIPDFANGADFRNDRMFYGRYAHAERWATGRFPFVKKYMSTDFGKAHCLHSERFMSKLIEDVPWETRPICFQRVGGGGKDLYNMTAGKKEFRKGDCAWYPPTPTIPATPGCGEMKAEFTKLYLADGTPKRT